LLGEGLAIAGGKEELDVVRDRHKGLEKYSGVEHEGPANDAEDDPLSSLEGRKRSRPWMVRVV